MTTLLFDLDDTLLGNDLDTFLPAYFQKLAAEFADLPGGERVIQETVNATRAMMGNADPARVLFDVFRDCFSEGTGWPEEIWRPRFDRFNADGYRTLQALTTRRPAARPPGDTSALVPEMPRVAIRRRVLIIEDNDDARQMLRHLLDRAGHEVHESAEGTDGLARALALSPDAVIVDIGLPGLDGYSIARRLREDGPPGLLLVAMTGYGQDGDRERSREAGFDAHLTKPIDPLVLDALLAKAGA
jgi:CheY-like chemotaxis protein